MEDVDRYFTPSEDPAERWELKELLPNVLLEIEHKVLRDVEFKRFWQQSIGESKLDRGNSNYWPISDWPGGNMLSSEEIEPHWWDDQIVLTHEIRRLCDDTEKLEWPIAEEDMVELLPGCTQFSIASVPSLYPTEQTASFVPYTVSGRQTDLSTASAPGMVISQADPESHVRWIPSETHRFSYSVGDPVNPSTAEHHWTSRSSSEG